MRCFMNMRSEIMILSRLHLENFKKYKLFDQEFGEGLIGIIGKNGSGKSTLFEAILFALYGELKNKGFKEIIRNASANHKDVVLVELEFESKGTLYKIVREFRGKALTVNAKLYKNDALIASGAKESTAAIIKLTQMSKDAFMHTLFASQKELTSLSTLKNEDRKKMIRRLLGLEKIDSIENSLVEKSRSLKREIASFAEVLLAKEEVETKTKLIQEKQNEQELLQKQLLEQNTSLEVLQKQIVQAKERLEKLAQTKEQKQKLQNEQELIKQSLTSKELRHKKLQEEQKLLELKQEELTKLLPLKAEFEALQKTLEEQNDLKLKKLKKESLLKEQQELREQYKKLRADIAKLETECANYVILQEHSKQKLQKLELQKQSLEKLRKTEQELKSECASEQKQKELLAQKIKKITELGKESACPTCTRPLLEEYDNVLDSLSSSLHQVHETKLLELEKQLTQEVQNREKLELEVEQENKEYLETLTQLRLIQSKQKDLQETKEYFAKIEQKGKANNEELKVLEELHYDETAHQTLQNRYKELQVHAKHISDLEVELKRVSDVEQESKELEQEMVKLLATSQANENKNKEILYDPQEHQTHKQLCDTLDEDKEKKSSQMNEMKVLSATLGGEIRTLQSALEYNETQKKKLSTKESDLKDYEKIKQSLIAFKSKLNAQITPRISDIASQMYARITKGKYQHIEVDNEFDFFIYEDGKRYQIERFSGGEIDLANLVLRIAISKTLTELSGAKTIEFLAFDEVFGSQDEARRLEILEAFHTLKEQYRQIFLISHEMEIKEMFEKLIEL
jgi:DNA repair protein SbcC/Rad50